MPSESFSIREPAGFERRAATTRSAAGSQPLLRAVPEETAVAFVYNGHRQAVMMATPADLEDFAIGFSLTEQIVGSRAEIVDIRTRTVERGIVVDLTVPEARAEALKAARARTLVGNSGCGLCGVDSLDQVERNLQPVGKRLRIDYGCVQNALAGLARQQRLNAETHAVHAAAWADVGGSIQALREDVGRHNALDKLIGARASTESDTGAGFCVITSRCSYEMVQKAAVAGFEVLVAISAPTALAIDLAAQLGMTLVALARPDSVLVFGGAERLLSGGSGLAAQGAAA